MNALQYLLSDSIQSPLKVIHRLNPPYMGVKQIFNPIYTGIAIFVDIKIMDFYG